MHSGKIYICDGDKNSRRFLEETLKLQGHQLTSYAQGNQLLQALEEQQDEAPDLLLIDMHLPDISGFDLLRRIKRLRPQLHVIPMNAFGTVRGAIEAMKQGAYDYLLKPFTASELNSLVDKLIEHNRLVSENRSLKAEIRRRFDPEQVVFKSPCFAQVFELAKKVAAADASILIMGESGAGKEIIASTIHYSSGRRDQRFLTINCAALTDTLLESQLFGHVKGAFTGAVGSQRGLIEEADLGTLFLDEIGDISPGLQAKLLRVLQEKEFIPVGSTKVRRANVRFVAATNKDLQEEVKAGRFREDLFYRLNVVTLQVPALRERPEDIEPLAKLFMEKFAGRGKLELTREAVALLAGYSWPGNVRELENVIEMAVILADQGVIDAAQLPPKLTTDQVTPMPTPKAGMTLEDVEKMYIEQIYRETGYHKLRTSQILDIARRTLDRKLQQYGIQKDAS
ncbi:two-component system, NtrC family, response regulator HydG [Malonomonas rubra DSM 5091]|uniref:DNA-binding transcriptional regulator NtrC n=1 Tax=Malonomonas rubra DSM 5091 TaxID=1122189 RepID=A0A1M6GDZ9_MALRU|nr:sigma-54 dependent transcriptional regulator [Malonomonas rubra]SHJ08165.1 two-component system, NtrC family, response regulator HydG [Malonomonas rubra DSM 5091]